MTGDEVQRCSEGVLDEVTAEAEAAKTQQLGDFAALIDYRAKWKRDAVLAFAERLRNAAK